MLAMKIAIPGRKNETIASNTANICVEREEGIYRHIGTCDKDL